MLFRSIGGAYGWGDGVNTFNLPDLRGVFIRGAGSQYYNGAWYSGEYFPSQTLQPSYAGYNQFRGFIDDGDDKLGNFGSFTALEVNGVQTVNGYDNPELTWTPTITVNTIPGDTRPINLALLYCIKF